MEPILKMGRRKAVIGIVLAVLPVLALAPGGRVLSVTAVKTGAPLLVLPMADGERITLQYIHSVENTPIWEVFSLDATGGLCIEEERYLKFGAGMGKMPGVGRLVMRGPYEVIENMHLPIGEFVLRIGSAGVNHTVMWRSTATNLSAVAPHAAVRFSARPVRLGHRLWRWIVPHPRTPIERKS